MIDPTNKRFSDLPPVVDAKSSHEPIYLASQLASICAVDLKTIHNWCDRQSDPMSPAELECFRTPGGHLRFRQSAVLRFLARWGYPIPSELLLDRPHLLIVEPDERRRIELIGGLQLRRPGRDMTDRDTQSGVMLALTREQTLGLFAHEYWYVHILADAQAALISAGERASAGVPFSLVILREDAGGFSPQQVCAAMQSRAWGQAMKFIIRASNTEHARKDAPARTVVSDDDLETLATLLNAEREQSELREKRSSADQESKPFEGSVARKDRIKILPREPIFVASQVAQIWNVDLKTVHNWVERGDIEAFSTPGRHLRFRRRALLHFLRRYNMPIPAEIAPKHPHLLLVCTPRQEHALRAMIAHLGSTFSCAIVHNHAEALVQLGEQSAGSSLVDAIVVFERDNNECTAAQLESWIAAVRSHPESRQSMLFVVRSSGSETPASVWQKAGVHVVIDGQDQTQIEQQIPSLLERTLGLTP
jgi:excisionase family DNA binding protein